MSESEGSDAEQAFEIDGSVGDAAGAQADAVCDASSAADDEGTSHDGDSSSEGYDADRWSDQESCMSDYKHKCEAEYAVHDEDADAFFSHAEQARAESFEVSGCIATRQPATVAGNRPAAGLTAA